MKKSLVYVLAAMLLVFPASVFAEGLSVPPGAVSEGAAETLLPVRIHGTIKNVREGDTTYVTVTDKATGEDVILKVSAETRVLDSATGVASSVGERTNDDIIAYYGPITTRSMPPQSNAVVIFVNFVEALNAPRYFTAESVDEKDGKTYVLCDNGGQYVVITDETPMLPYLTRNIVTRAMIVPGTKLAVWYGITTLSYPGIAHADRVVILEQPQASQNADVNFGQKEPLDLFAGESYDKEGVRMVPLRAAALIYGWEIAWDPDARTVTLTKDGKEILIAIDIIGCSSSGFEPAPEIKLELAPEIKNNRTFVPEIFLELLK